MTRFAIPAALAVALALSACQAPYAGADATLAAAASKIGADVAAANSTIKKLSNGKIVSACKTIAVAQGYYDAVAPVVAALAPAQASAAATAFGVVKDVCANPPQDVASAMTSLGTAWAVIQAATTVPGK